MAINTETIDSISEKVRGYFNANMTGVDAFLPQTFLYVAAKVFALAIYPLYFILNYVARQAFATTADAEYLELHGSERGISRIPAAAASGSVQVISVAGTSITQGTVLSRADGIQYEFSASIVTTGDDLIAIEALNVGSEGNALANTEMTLDVSDTDIASIVVSDNGIVGGREIETDDQLRSRILFSKRNFSLTGTANYFAVILQGAVSATRVFFDDPKDGSGQFSIYFMMDDSDNLNGIPTAGDVALAQAAIDGQSGYYVGTTPIVLAPDVQEINVSITVYSAISQAVQDAITLEIQDVIQENGKLSTATEPSVFFKEDIDAAVSRGLGNNGFEVVLPSANIAIEQGKIPIAGTITISVSA